MTQLTLKRLLAGGITFTIACLLLQVRQAIAPTSLQEVAPLTPAEIQSIQSSEPLRFELVE